MASRSLNCARASVCIAARRSTSSRRWCNSDTRARTAIRRSTESVAKCSLSPRARSTRTRSPTVPRRSSSSSPTAPTRAPTSPFARVTTSSSSRGPAAPACSSWSTAPAQLERYLEKRELARFTPKTIVERESLFAELDQVRRNGIAFDDGEFDAEVRCVAVPVYDFLGRLAGAIGISGPMWRLSLQSLHEKSRLVRQSAAEFSAELGYRGEQKAEEA